MPNMLHGNVGEQPLLRLLRVGVDSEAGGFHGRHDRHGAAAHAYREKQFIANLGAEFIVL